MRFRLLFPLLLLSATAAFAQLKESINVSVVEVPVTVIGHDGNPVRGLAASNFEVLDNGKRRVITGFEAIDFASPAFTASSAVPAMTPINPAARRNFMLLFDLSYSNPNALIRAKAAAREFVSRSVNRRDRVAVGTIDTNRGFRLVTAFTTDRNVVRSAIESPAEFIGTDPLQITATNAAPVPEPVLAANSFSPTAHEAKLEQASEAQRVLARQAEEFDDSYRRHQVDRQLEILAMISRTMNTVYGRKEIILLSEGFDPKLIQGRRPMTKEGEEDQVAVERGEIWRVNSDQSFGNAESQSLLGRFAEMCRRSDVTLHAIDIHGLRDQMEPGSDAPETQEALHLLASAGGGHVFKNTNDLASSFDRMLHQQEVTYVLAFRAPTENPGVFHKLSVKLVDVPAGSHASCRSGYYEAGSANEAERALATAEIMVNDVPQHDIHVDALPSVFTGIGERAAVPVVVDINGSDLMRIKDDPILIADVFVYAFDADGGVRDSLFQRLTIDTDKLGAKLNSGGVKYLGTLSLPSGAYAIKTLVRLPEIGRNGFVRRDIVVPERNTAVISPPLFFADSAKWVLVKGSSHDPSGTYPFVVGDATFVPSAAARLEAGESRRFVVLVPHAAADAVLDVKPAAALVGRSGDAFIFDLQPDGARGKAIDAALRGSTATSSVVVETP
jgi:VWFA-related protein